MTYGKHWTAWQERKRLLWEDILRQAAALTPEEVQQQLSKLREEGSPRKLSQRHRARLRSRERRLEALARKDPERLRERLLRERLAALQALQGK
jgi:hypothetical protein